jgi:hypothetical protein
MTTPTRLPALRPQCPHHGAMEPRPGHTAEQRWCGTWYACPAPRCATVTLLPSPALTAQLAHQQRAAVRRRGRRREAMTTPESSPPATSPSAGA